MKGLSESPNSAPFVGSYHINSLIYDVNDANPNDFPVKGYVVGAARSIWSYSDCVAPDFGFV